MSRATDVGRYVVIGGLVVTGLAIVVAVVVVGLGEGPTTTARLTTGLNQQLLVVAVPIAILVEGALIYAVWRFRNNDDPKPTPENRKLELAWTVATGLVLVFVGVSSYHVLAQPAVTATADPGSATNTVRIDVTGHQWYWGVEYPGENVSIERADRIVLPVDRPIRIELTSGDVIHSFHAPRLGLKQDAIPGETNVLTTKITRTGEYRLYCAEYCGQGHAYMQSTIEVVSAAEYRDWLAQQNNASSSA